MPSQNACQGRLAWRLVCGFGMRGLLSVFSSWDPSSCSECSCPVQYNSYSTHYKEAGRPHHILPHKNVSFLMRS